MNFPPLTDDNGNELVDPYGLPMYEETELTIPSEVAKDLPEDNAGVLPRRDYPGETCVFWSDVPRFRRNIIQPSDWAKWLNDPAKPGNRRGYVNWIYDQNGVGSCASEGLHGCLDSLREKQNQEPVKFNPWPTYYEACGGIDRGSTLTANLRILRDKGAVPMDLWPRYGSGGHRWNDVPPSNHEASKARKNYRIQEYYEIRTPTEAASALFADHAVYAAYPGHAWELIGVINTQQAMWRNSWGDGWSDQGFGIINWSSITFQYGLFAIESCTLCKS